MHKAEYEQLLLVKASRSSETKTEIVSAAGAEQEEVEKESLETEGLADVDGQIKEIKLEVRKIRPEKLSDELHQSSPYGA